jgi:dihydropteroate synthase
MNRPAIMGILNVTTDSFSGDGRLAADAVKHAEKLVDCGADIIDIGAESTRPGAAPISAEEEWARLSPVLTGIIAYPWRARVRLSIDTRHATTASHALALGVDIINDVSGLIADGMAETLEEHECDIVLMHALGMPANPALTLPPKCDVVREILKWKAKVTERAVAHGIATHRLIYDPGIGFGKTAEQSLALIERAAGWLGIRANRL